jgi:hypothetical protein
LKGTNENIEFATYSASRRHAKVGELSTFASGSQ